MHDEWTDQLSALLDDELPPAARDAVLAHIESCPACRQVLSELRAVQAWAPEYRGTTPPSETWAGIAAAIGTSKTAVLLPRRAPRFSLGQLAAASILVAALSGGGMWLLLRPGPEVQQAQLPAPAPGFVAASSPAVGSDLAWDAAVGELQQVLDAGRGRLDSATIRIIEANLMVIDSAIAETRVAIAADPSNVHLAARIRSNMQRKLVLLRQAARAAGTAS